MKAKENLYRRIAVALGSISYDVTADGEALKAMAELLEDMLDLIDEDKLIVIEHVDYVEHLNEDGEYK